MDMQVWRPRLMSGQWFSHLPVSLQDSLLSAARLRRLSPGQRLFKRGDPPCGLYAVLEGAVRVGAVSEQGKEALLSLVEPPHWFGEICLFDGQPRTHDAYGSGPVHAAAHSPEHLAGAARRASAALAATGIADEPEIAHDLHQPRTTEPVAGPGTAGAPLADDRRRLWRDRPTAPRPATAPGAACRQCCRCRARPPTRSSRSCRGRGSSG